MNKDCRKLVSIYLQLKEMEVELLEMELCHSTHKEFVNIISKSINELDKIAHLLVAEAGQIKEDKNEEADWPQDNLLKDD